MSISQNPAREGPAARETVQGLLAGAEHALSGTATPRLDAELLLARALRTERVALYTHPRRPVPAAAARGYRRSVRQRARGVPLAYLTGRRAFWSFDLEVSGDTLVPRPETEHLVEQALRLIDTYGLERVAELGTGSGAIAIAIARDAPAVRVTATDRSRSALAVASHNARRLAPGRIDFIAGHWSEALAARAFDLIVSNPPYLSISELECAEPELRHEPRLALDGGRDGLMALLRIVAAAPRHLTKDGWIALEHGACQGQAVRGLLRRQGFRRSQTIRDYAGHERVTLGQRS